MASPGSAVVGVSVNVSIKEYRFLLGHTGVGVGAGTGVGVAVGTGVGVGNGLGQGVYVG